MTDRKQKFEDLSLSLGKLVGEKDEHYGEIMNSTSLFLQAVFPNGITVDQYDVVGLLVRIFDKQKRATHPGHDHAEDWRDIAGYGIQGLSHYTE